MGHDIYPHALFYADGKVGTETSSLCSGKHPWPTALKPVLGAAVSPDAHRHVVRESLTKCAPK